MLYSYITSVSVYCKGYWSTVQNSFADWRAVVFHPAVGRHSKNAIRFSHFNLTWTSMKKKSNFIQLHFSESYYSIHLGNQLRLFVLILSENEKQMQCLCFSGSHSQDYTSFRRQPLHNSLEDIQDIVPLRGSVHIYNSRNKNRVGLDRLLG